MPRLPFIAVGLIAIGACNAEPETARPTEKAAEAPASDAVVTPPAVLTADDLRRVCRAGLAAIHGQQVADIQIDGLEGQVISASWRAPVDGGRRTAQCRVEGDRVAWRPTGLPDAEQSRWMTQAGDTAARYVMDGQQITITQTFPDGTTSQAMMAVPTANEAR